MVVKPRIGTPRSQALTLGADLVRVAKELGFSPHEWQRYAGNVSLELTERPRRGRRAAAGSKLKLAAGNVGAIVGRQSGKTAFAAARIALQCRLPDLPGVARRVGLDVIRPQKVAYTAQDRGNARLRWLEHLAMLTSTPALQDRIADVVLQRGAEVIKFKNGSEYGIVTPSRTGARGASLDLVIVDEALAHPSWLLAAMRPTMAQRDSAIGCIGAQFVVVSNAGDERSSMLADLRELGRRAVIEGDRSRCWLEWSAPDDCDPYDERVWYATLPTLNQDDGIGIEYLRAEAETMNTDDWSREYLCITTSRDLSPLIDAEVWATLPNLTIPVNSPVVLGVDATWERTSAAIVAATSLGDDVAVEVIAQHGGVDWLADRVVQLAADHPNARVVVDKTGPASVIIPTLERAGVEHVIVSTAQVTEAAAMLVDLVASGHVGHGADPRLDAAVINASRRKVGERWAFKRSGAVDPSPLIAASLAMWAVSTQDQLVASVW